MKWYFSDTPVSFNFLVIGKDSFDKNIFENTLKQSQIILFQTVSFCPDHSVQFCPSDLLFTVFVTIQNTTPQNSSDYLETYQYLYSSLYTIQLRYISTTFFTFIKKLIPSKYTYGASKVNCLYKKLNLALFWLSVSYNMEDFNTRIQFE